MVGASMHFVLSKIIFDHFSFEIIGLNPKFYFYFIWVLKLKRKGRETLIFLLWNL